MLISATNEAGIDRRLRIAYAWASFLFFHSITEIHPVTRVNLVLHSVGSLFLFANNAVFSPRLCTEEPCEHVFGLCRMFDREFTVRGFCQYTEKLQQFFEASCRSGLNTGGRNGKGYLGTLSAFIESLKAYTPKRYRTGDHTVRCDFSGVDVDPLKPASAQLFEFLLPIINEVSSGMRNLLKAFGFQSFQTSIFAQSIASIEQFNYIVGAALAQGKSSQTVDLGLKMPNLSEQSESSIIEILSSRLAWALEQPECCLDMDFPESSISTQNDAVVDAVDVEEDEHFICDSSSRFIDLLQRISPSFSLFEIAAAATKCFPVGKTSMSMNLQQHRSLQSRWYTRSDVLGQGDEQDLIRRGSVCKHQGHHWLILSIFKKGYGKFRLIESVPVIEAVKSNNIRMHCIRMKQSSIGDSFAVIVPDTSSLSTIKNSFANIFPKNVDRFTEIVLLHEEF